MVFLRTHQLNLMLLMSGACAILACTTLFIKALPENRKSILSLMELSAMLLLLFDRYCYLYRGNTSQLGYIMVRVCNGMVFFLAIMIPELVTQYLKDLFQDDRGHPASLLSLKICDALFVLGVVFIVVSQFTGLYYTFDAQNTYHRAPTYVLSYISPALIVLLQELTIVKKRDCLSRRVMMVLMAGIAIPTVFAIMQIFTYGVSLSNMATVLTVIMFHVFALDSLSRSVQEARAHELESCREAERRVSAMFEQTAQALATAIDAKDTYTHGHSTRVAALSRQIAKEAGFTEKDCDQVYFAGLLHDVGKIGISNEIINKVGKLTDEEFAQIKLHPILGYQILSIIKESPSLSIGAHYHHERYDGRGYPDGLSGEDIPEIARIIAVADACDAMSSNRSYRNRLTQAEVRDELIDGIGKQFDPRFAEIMARMVESGEADLLAGSAPQAASFEPVTTNKSNV